MKNIPLAIIEPIVPSNISSATQPTVPPPISTARQTDRFRLNDETVTEPVGSVTHSTVTEDDINSMTDDDDYEYDEHDDDDYNDDNNDSTVQQRFPLTNLSTEQDAIEAMHVEEDTVVDYVGEDAVRPNNSSDISSIDSEGEFYEKNKTIFVKKARRNTNGYIIRNKGHCCLYCHKVFINLPRHLEKVHSKEIDVAKLCSLPKNFSQRRNGFTELGRTGDFYYNCETLKKEDGELILVRRPTKCEEKYFTYKDYGPCPECLGFMLKKHLWRHLKYSCSICNKNIKTNSTQNTQVLSESKSLLASILFEKQPKQFVEHIILKLRDGEVTNAVKQDELILKFGLLLYDKYGITQAEMTRQHMRQLGRLVIELREHDPNKSSLAEWLFPSCFDIVVDTVKSLCKVHELHDKSMRPTFGIPSLALKLGHHIRKCISIEKGSALRKCDRNRCETLDCFMQLIDLEWSTRISSSALATLYTKKMNASNLLPLTEDLVKFNNFIEKEIKNLMCVITQNDKIDWKRLCSLTLAKIILFNKRRSGEASRMKIKDFISKPDLKHAGLQDFKNSLTELERKISERLCVVEVMGKRGKKVPVLLTPLVEKAVEWLVEKRYDAGVIKENPYVFARCGGSQEHVRGHDCIKNLANEIELKFPTLINGTKLRKYIATVCQLFNLTETETDWLARHLGHDIRVHREFYRLHESTVETSKISRLLLAVEKGKAQEFAGKKLHEIHLSGKFCLIIFQKNVIHLILYSRNINII